MRRAWVFPAAMLGGLLFAACSTTRVTGTWRDPSITATDFKNVLVVALVPEETVRRHLEEEMVAELGQAGVRAVPSHQIQPDDTPLDRESVRAMVERNGFDSVLVTQYLGTERELQYVPPTHDAFGWTYFDYFGYWGPRVFSPGYMREVRTVKLESRFFDAREGGRMVWSAATSTLDPISINREIPRLADKIVDRLQKDVPI